MIRAKCWNRYRHERTYTDVYILSRGKNSGKPLREPCPNCFVIRAVNDEQREMLFSLLTALWIGRCFEPYLVGTCVELIRLGDLHKVMDEALSRARDNPAEFKKIAAQVNTSLQLEKQAHERLKLIRVLKVVASRQLLSLGSTP